MLGTIVNVVAIVVGSLLGIFLKGGLKDKYKESIMKALGLAVVYVGMSGAIESLLNPESNSLLFIISLAIGTLIGEWIDIEKRLGLLGDFIEKKMEKSTSNVSLGFVSASLIFCIGTMAILGSIEGGISGQYTILYAKSILDGIMSIVLASSLGIGVMFSAISVFVYQGFITICAVNLQPFITADILREMGIVGGILISVIGLNLLDIIKIKVGNMLPAIFIPVVYYCVKQFL